MEQEKNMQRHSEEKETILREQTRKDAEHETISEQNRAEYEVCLDLFWIFLG